MIKLNSRDESVKLAAKMNDYLSKKYAISESTIQSQGTRRRYGGNKKHKMRKKTKKNRKRTKKTRKHKKRSKKGKTRKH